MSGAVETSAHALATLLFDDGPGVGLGHRRRIEALAEAIRRRGLDVIRGPIARWPEMTGGADVVVVDSYSVRADELPLGQALVVAVDDLDRALAVDVLVEPSPAPPGLAPPGAGRRLCGFEYALVQPRRSTRSGGSGGGTPRVLVTMGGSDDVGRGAAIAARLARDRAGVQVVHAPGPWSVPTEDPGVAVLPAEADLVPHLADATVVVCAGGVTMLESLMSGCPTVVVKTAENQDRAVRGVERAHAAEVVEDPDDVAEVVSAAARLLDSADLRRRLGARGASIVDGRGPDRVAAVIVELLGRVGRTHPES